MKFGIKTVRWILGTTLLTSALGVGMVGVVNVASADEGWKIFGRDDDDDEHGERRNSASKQLDNSPVRQLYVDECAACHMAYPAGFLPERSWQKMMGSLDDHFGENAELDATTQQAITQYLVDNAAEKSSNRRARKFLRSVSDNATPLRITELRYFKKKHDEVPDRMVTGNPDVGSFSQCQTCHGDRAEQGYFDDDSVNIPNHGRWDD
jgi:mono/diheme cytochrome c family protein